MKSIGLDLGCQRACIREDGYLVPTEGFDYEKRMCDEYFTIEKKWLFSIDKSYSASEIFIAVVSYLP